MLLKVVGFEEVFVALWALYLPFTVAGKEKEEKGINFVLQLDCGKKVINLKKSDKRKLD